MMIENRTSGRKIAGAVVVACCVLSIPVRADGPFAWRYEFHRPIAAGSVQSSNMSWQLNVQGDATLSAIATASVGNITFTNIVVDVRKYPILRFDVSRAASAWNLQVRRANGTYSNLHSATAAGRGAINLQRTLGFNGVTGLFIRLQTAGSIDARDLSVSATVGWETFDAFDTHRWAGEFAAPAYTNNPHLGGISGWMHPYSGEFSAAHPAEGRSALRVSAPIVTNGNPFNFMYMKTVLPEPENWSMHNILTFDPYQEGSPLSLPSCGLILKNAQGQEYHVSLILGWQLFQWENRLMTYPLQGNVQAGVSGGVTNWQIPPIPANILTNVKEVILGFEYYADPEQSGNGIHLDNLRLGSTKLWDGFEGPQYGWSSTNPTVTVGITGNKSYDNSAGSLCIRWAGTGSTVFARTAGTPWSQNWQAYSNIRAQVQAKQANTGLRLVINNTRTTAVVTVGSSTNWTPVRWTMPSGVIAVTQLEFRVTGAATGTLYADNLEVGIYTSRISKVDGWALNSANRLTWTLAQTNGLTHVRVAYQTNEPPATATNGTVAADIAINGQTLFTFDHTNVVNGVKYHYAIFLRQSNGTYTPLSDDAVFTISRNMTVINGGGYNAAFSRDNGALLYVDDTVSNRTVCYGTEAGNLWRTVFMNESIPELRSSWFSPSNATMGFTMTQSPLSMKYDYVNGTQSMTLVVAVDSSVTNQLRLKLSVTNRTAEAVRIVDAPYRLNFLATNVNRLAFPMQEGVAFRKDFFLGNHYTFEPRPWLFADFVGLDSQDGLLAFYAIQDSFYNADILPKHATNRPVFQPSNIGAGTSPRNARFGFMEYEMVNYIPPGRPWTSPTLVLQSGGGSIRSALADYKQANSFNDTNLYPTLKQKMDGFGLFDYFAGSPLMAIECDKAVLWQKAPVGALWSSVRDQWLSQIPRDTVLHFTHWQNGILEDDHPDSLPLNYNRYGSEDDFKSMLAAAHADGRKIMPFCNWSVWNKAGVVQRDSSGALVPIPEACLKPRGTNAAYYEYFGYMTKPWQDNASVVHSNMMMNYTTNYPMDAMFVDMTCERTWRYTRVDADGNGSDESIFTGYTQGVIDQNNFLKKFFPLFTEGVFDRMMGEVSGYCQTMRQKRMMDILAHIGTEFTDWVVFPLAADVAHDHVGFYQHDLNLQVFPITKRLLTHYTLMGYCYIVDVASWMNENNAAGENWMFICDDFQKSVVAKCYGKPLNKYLAASGNDEKIITTSYGSGTGEVTVVANFRDAATYTTNGFSIAPEGFMATAPNGLLIAGVFSNLFNGAALAAGDHFIIVDRTGASAITVKHPVGADTQIRIARPSGWTNGILATYILRDGSEVLGPGLVTSSGTNLLVNLTKLAPDGSTVAAFRIVDASGADTPPLLLASPAFETESPTQVWVSVRANKSVSAVIRYGVDSVNELAITNSGLSSTHNVLAGLPVADMGYWFQVTLTDSNGQSTTSAKVYYPVGGTAWMETFDPQSYAFDLSAEAEKDIVCNAGDGSNQPFGDVPGDTQCFAESGFNGATGLPSNRMLPSNDPELGIYHLLPYSGPNVLEFATQSPLESHMVSVPIAGRTTKLGILAAAVQGDASFTITCHYSDGSSSTHWWETDDWYDYGARGNVIKVAQNLDRANAFDGAIEDSNHFNLYEFIFDASRGLDTNKTLTAITIGNDPNRWPTNFARYGAVFAVNGYGKAADLTWRDKTVISNFNTTVTASNGYGIVTIDPGVSGKALSQLMTVDLSRYPIMEVVVGGIDPGITDYQIGLQEESAPYAYMQLFGDSRPATMVLDIPKLTGWNGMKTFSVQIGLNNTSAVARSLTVDYLKLRSRSTVAWSDGMNPPRSFWKDQSTVSGMNAELEPLGGGVSRIRQTGVDVWGRVQSGMLVMDLGAYPWLTTAISGVDSGANFKVNVQYEAPPYSFPTIVSTNLGPSAASGVISKAGAATLDLFSLVPIIEGQSKEAVIDDLRIAARAPGQASLAWDSAVTLVQLGEGDTTWQPIQALYYGSGSIQYSASGLPAGAGYNGIFTWTVASGQAGTYRPVLMASAGGQSINRTLTLLVTNATLQLLAPQWSMSSISVTSSVVSVGGSYAPGTNVILEVSVNGGAYSSAGVTVSNGTFTWAGPVANPPMTLLARVRNTSTGKMSSGDTCVVNLVGGHTFLVEPVLETEDATSVWVIIKAATQVTARVNYGLNSVSESSLAVTNLVLTHTILVQPLLAGSNYYIQVVLQDASGKQSLSDILFYPASGTFWAEEFSGSVAGWRDQADDPIFNCTLTASNGQGVVTLPASMNGKVLSAGMTVDVDKFPILEVAISKADFANVGYEIGLQQEVSPWVYKPLFGDSRSGTMILNIPQLTGWTGTQTFSFAFNMGNADPVSRSINIESVRLRMDRNVAWEDSFGPPRSSWRGESIDGNFNAELDNLSNGTARLRQTGQDVWGQVQGEMLVMDLAQYPWMNAAVSSVASGANFKAAYQFQTSPYAFTVLVSRSDAPYSQSGRVAKSGSNALDLVRVSMIIEGQNKNAVVDRLRITKRDPSPLSWDSSQNVFTLAEGAATSLYLTATATTGEPILYGYVGLPAGATYNGIFAWTPQTGQAGTYRPSISATAGSNVVARELEITVTSSTIQLVAPRWNTTSLSTTSGAVSIGGTFATGSNIVVEVAVNGGAFGGAGVSVNGSAFQWTGNVVSSPMQVKARVRNTATGKISSYDVCSVTYSGTGPAFLVQPVLERASATSVWVYVKAPTSVTAQVNYGIAGVDENMTNSAGSSFTHAILVQPLQAGTGYWFQVAIRDAQNRLTFSDIIFYPVGGAVWNEDFTGGVTGWRDRFVDPTFVCTITASNGLGVVTLPAAGAGSSTNGKVLSAAMAINLDAYPILEVAIAQADFANVGYEIGLQEETAPYAYKRIFGDSRSGTMVFNIPQLTGWSSTKTFSVTFAMSNGDTTNRSIKLESMKIRTDGDIAWDDLMNPRRASWHGESVNPAFDAELDNLSNGTARLRQVGGAGWGQVQSEMLVLDLASYPWMSLDVTAVSSGANVKAAYQFQTPPYAFTQLLSRSDAPYTEYGMVTKSGTQALDLVRAALVIEGSNKTATIDALRIGKRNPASALAWDNPQQIFQLGAGTTNSIWLTATDYKGGAVQYSAVSLPGNSTYDGRFSWAPQQGEQGTYFPLVIASSPNGAITNELIISVTNEFVQFIAPRWSASAVAATASVVTVGGTYYELATNMILEVSVNGGGTYTNAGVVASNGTFTWTGNVVSSPMTLRARMRKIGTFIVSSGGGQCDVSYASPVSLFLEPPRLEREYSYAVWVIVKATTQCSARVNYGVGTVTSYSQVQTNLSLTHAFLVSLVSGADFQFQVALYDAQGRVSFSDVQLYPFEGAVWRSDFTSDAAGWRDETSNPGFVAHISATNGQGVITLPAAGSNGVNGKVLSQVITADVSQFPILEVDISKADYPGVGYEVGLQEEEAPWSYKPLLAESRSGTLIFNIPQLTSWTGTHTFSVAFNMGSIDPVSRSINLDLVHLRTDSAIAWRDEFNPMRSTWIGDSNNPAFNANLTQTTGGWARLAQTGQDVWGQVQSEMIVLDAAQYPWMSVQAVEIDPSANVKGNIQFQTPPYETTTLFSRADAPYEAAGRIGKAGTNALDLLRAALVIEGSNKAAKLDRIHIGKHNPTTLAAEWDSATTTYKIGLGQASAIRFTATDYHGYELSYSSAGLPSGATYDGVFRWTPVWPQVGTFRPVLMVSNLYTVITQRLVITVTNASIQLESPLWSQPSNTVPSNVVTLTGTYPALGPGQVIEVSRSNTTSYSTSGVTLSNGVFSWTGSVAGAPTPVYARVRDTGTGVISSDERTDVLLATLAPQFLGLPVFETHSTTQVWVKTRADQSVAVGIAYGTTVSNIGAFSKADTNRWMTHATLVSGLSPTQAYWFRVSITNAGGYVAVSTNLFYPAAGNVWQDAFSSSVAGWQTNDVLSIRTNGQGQAVISIPGGQSWGTVQTAPMTVDLEAFPIFEMSITRVDNGNMGYVIMLKDNDAPYAQPVLLQDGRPGTMVLDIRKVTGWSGTKNFAVAIGLSSLTSAVRSIDVDYISIHADRTVAWQEDPGPLRKTWIDETSDTNLNAYIEDLSNGTARVRQNGQDVWGQVRSEMLYMDLAQYPWFSISGPGVNSNATLKAEVLNQTVPYNQVNLTNYASMSSSTVYQLDARVQKFGTNLVDWFRSVLVIEGSNQQARIDQVRFAKRAMFKQHVLYWDFPATSLVVSLGATVKVPFTATDYEGANITYQGVNLPSNATYNGVFQWTPQAVGTFPITFIANNGTMALTNVLSITVTSLYKVHLAYDDASGIDSFPQATAALTNHTGAAATWMTASYLLGAPFGNSQTQIYAATLHDATHNNEIIASNDAAYLNSYFGPTYSFRDLARTNLNAAMREIVYWIDYQSVGGMKTPVHILSGTEWSYKVVRGFQTDIKPYDGGSQPATNFMVYGMWINDPRVSGLGHNTYVPASQMTNAFRPSDASGNYRMVVDPPEGAAFAAAEERIAATTLSVAESPKDAAVARFLASIVTPPTLARRGVTSFGPVTVPDLARVVPQALMAEKGFRQIYDTAQHLEVYAVNEGQADAYVLVAGCLRGPASAQYVLRMNPADGSVLEATWCAAPTQYLPVDRDAAIWQARQQAGDPDAAVLSAKLVYSPDLCASPFLPAWQVELQSGTNLVMQGIDLSHDSDADGMSDGSELYAGSDPMSGASVFTIDAGAGETVVLTWPSVAGKTYSVHRSTDLLNGFTRIAGGIAATPPVNVFRDNPQTQTFYYRIEVE